MSTTPMKGKADYLALGDWNVACAECGRKFKASEMRQLPPGVPGGGMWVCLPHWNQRQPQDYVRGVADKMAAPYVQQQVEEYPLEVENVDADDAALEIEIDTAAAASGAEPLIINVFEGVTVGTLTITDVAGGTPAASIVLNNNGVIETLENLDGVTVTVQGSGVVVETIENYSLVAVAIPPTTTEDLYGYDEASVLGSLTPATYAGETIIIFEAGLNRFSVETSVITFDGTGILQTLFTSVTIGAITLASADAAFTDNGTTCTWAWTGASQALYLIAGTYTPEFA